MQPPKSNPYQFWPKRDWNCAFMVAQIHIILWKGLSPCDHKKSYISVNLDPQKRAWNYPHLARKIHQGAPPCNPDRGPAPPPGPSGNRSVCSLRYQLLEPPCWKSPKSMLHILNHVNQRLITYCHACKSKEKQ